MFRWFLLICVSMATIQQRKPCIDNCLNDDIVTDNIIVNCLQLKCREIIQNISKYNPAIKIYVREHAVYNDLSDHMEAYMHKKHMMQRINEYGELKLKSMTQDVIDSYLVYTNILTQVYKLLDSLNMIESVEEEQKAFQDMEAILNFDRIHARDPKRRSDPECRIGAYICFGQSNLFSISNDDESTDLDRTFAQTYV